MTFEELTKEISRQYNLTHQTKIKVTLPMEIKDYEIKIDVTIKGFKYQTRNLTEIEFDKQNKTITLKGKL